MVIASPPKTLQAFALISLVSSQPAQIFRNRGLAASIFEGEGPQFLSL